MPTDQERRTIARRLRRCSPTLDNALTFLRVFEAVYGTLPEDGAAMGMPRYLATLIDRPTCSDTESKDSKSFTCSACGFSESKLVVSPFTLSFSSVKPSYRYCPKCGAAVTESGGCDVRKL